MILLHVLDVTAVVFTQREWALNILPVVYIDFALSCRNLAPQMENRGYCVADQRSHARLQVLCRAEHHIHAVQRHALCNGRWKVGSPALCCIVAPRRGTLQLFHYQHQTQFIERPRVIGCTGVSARRRAWRPAARRRAGIGVSSKLTNSAAFKEKNRCGVRYCPDCVVISDRFAHMHESTHRNDSGRSQGRSMRVGLRGTADLQRRQWCARLAALARQPRLAVQPAILLVLLGRHRPCVVAPQRPGVAPRVLVDREGGAVHRSNGLKFPRHFARCAKSFCRDGCSSAGGRGERDQRNHRREGAAWCDAGAARRGGAQHEERVCGPGQFGQQRRPLRRDRFASLMNYFCCLLFKSILYGVI